MNKFVKILISIFILILIILLILFVVRFYRVNKIIELMKKNSEIDNYYFEDSNFVKKRYKNIIMINPISDSNLYYYYDFDNSKYYVIDENSETYYEYDITESNKDLLNFPLYYHLTFDYSFKNKLKLVFLWKIKKYDDTKYEIIKDDNDKAIFDCKTGFVVSINDIETGNIVINKLDDIQFLKLFEYSKMNQVIYDHFQTIFKLFLIT